MPTEQQPTFSSITGALLSGEIGAEHALELARSPGVRDELTLKMVSVIGDSARGAADEGDWRHPVKLWPVLLAAIGADEDRPADLRIQVAVADFIFVVTEALKDVPDARLLRVATRYGDHAARLASVAGDAHWLSFQTMRLGALHQLPYVPALRNPRDKGAQVRWRQRVVDENGGQAPEDSEMPDPVTALSTACAYFEASLATGVNPQEGFTQKLFAEALFLRRRLGDETVAPDAILEHANAALRKLPDDRLDWRAEAAAIINDLAGTVDLDETLSKVDAARGGGAEGRPATFANGLSEVRALASINSARAEDLARQLWQKAAGATEQQRRDLASLYLGVLSHQSDVKRLFPPAPGSAFLTPPQCFERARDALNRELAALKSRGREAFLQLIGLVACAGEHDSEAAALDLLEQAAACEGTGVDRSLLLAIAAVLAVDHGAVAWQGQDYPVAARRYLDAAGLCSRVDLHEAARDAFLRALEAIAEADYPADDELVVALAAAAPPIEAADPTAQVSRELRKCWSLLIAAATKSQSPPSGLLFFMLQAAKGALFSATLGQGPYPVNEDEHLQELLRDIGELAPDLSPAAALVGEAEEYLLAAVDDSLGFEGRTRTERAFNLQRRFDRLLTELRLATAGASDDYPLGIEHCADLLDSRTVVMTVYCGRSAVGEIACWAALVTGEAHFIHAASTRRALHAQLGLTVGGGKLDDFAMDVASARQVRIHPGRIRLIVSQAADALRALRPMLLGALEAPLRELRSQGFDHLAICAHGSTHFLPWHLLMADESPLADDWIVTYLPSLALLRPQPVPRRKAAMALGLAFEGDQPHGQRALPHVLDELQAIAQASGAELFLNEAANEKALAYCFRQARWLHIATHGEQHVAAPAFHALYLAPDGESDGILHAHEMLAYDLRGLELVTLGACETALGRIDTGDNLRGLPAAFFQAGAETIVGTLWEVSSEAAAYFFAELYGQLSKSGNKLEAFSAAQRVTREQFPAYVHWGAFHYFGRW